MSVRARFVLERQEGSRPFVLDVDLELATTSIGVLGLSGSGKTTLLRCIAGLERPRLARLFVNGERWQDERFRLPTHARRVGYVFQEASLFPHLSTRDNLLFGYQRVARGRRKVAFDDAVSLLGLEGLLGRPTEGLSGGERQRVALGRALLTSPELLLLDEPLASLDLAGRAQVLRYLEEVQRALAIPMLYVSHAPSELARVAHQALVLEDGKLLAQGPLNSVFTRPDLFLAQREDAAALLEAEVEAHDDTYHLTTFRVPGAPGARLTLSRRSLPVGHTTRLQIHARDVALSLAAPRESSVGNVLEVTVLSVHAEREPAHRLVLLDLQGRVLLARVTLLSVEQLKIAPGLSMFAQVKSVALSD